jgi:hypothetical protein
MTMNKDKPTNYSRRSYKWCFAPRRVEEIGQEEDEDESGFIVEEDDDKEEWKDEP